MTNSNDQLSQIADLLKQSVIASDQRMTRLEYSMVAGEERMARLEQTMERQSRESNERMNRLEQVVDSNNKFLEAFSDRLSRYTDTMHTFLTRIDGVIATSNQDRDEIKAQLSAIRRQGTKGDQPQP